MKSNNEKVFPVKSAGKNFHAADLDIAVAVTYEETPVFKVKSIDISLGAGKYSKTGNRDVDSLFRTLESWFNGDIALLPVKNLNLENLSTFEMKVLCELRKRVFRGNTVSYGELAKLAGFPGAAQAVGTVMSKNPFPLFFPCHRVIKGDGSIGFFQGGPGGVRLKNALLEMEGRK